MSRGPATARQAGMSGWSPAEGEPHPFLGSAVLYVDAELDSSGANLGTAGSALDSVLVAVDGASEKAAGAQGEAGVARAPHAARFNVSGSFCIAVDVHPDWSPLEPCQFMFKPLNGGGDTGTDDCFAFGISTGTGVPYVEFTRDGETEHEAYVFTTGDGASEDVQPGTDGDTDRKQWVLDFVGDNGDGGWTASLYEGDPSDPTLISEIVNTTDGAVTLETSTTDLVVGTPLFGALYRARLYDELGGTLLADFHPDADWTSGTTITAPTTEVWSGVWILDSEATPLIHVPADAALNIAADADATVAFWADFPFLADTDGELWIYANHSTGSFGSDIDGFLLFDGNISGAGVDAFGVTAGDGVDQAFAMSNTGWTAGEHVVVFTVDRDADVLTVYRDGTEHATFDISSVGAMDPAAGVTLSSANWHAVAKWDSVQDAATIAAARS